jgi:hypothetical protein
MPEAREQRLEVELAKARAETRVAFENRALMYAYIYEELEMEIGPQRAADLMRRALFRRGLEEGGRYREAVSAGDLEQVVALYIEGSPAGGSLFEPDVQVVTEGGDRVVLRMSCCPLKDAWRVAGFSAEKVERLCEIASAADEGTFKGAGLELGFLDRQTSRGSGVCLLELRLRS